MTTPTPDLLPPPHRASTPNLENLVGCITWHVDDRVLGVDYYGTNDGALHLTAWDPDDELEQVPWHSLAIALRNHLDHAAQALFTFDLITHGPGFMDLRVKMTR
jgi:hypothetical protein